MKNAADKAAARSQWIVRLLPLPRGQRRDGMVLIGDAEPVAQIVPEGQADFIDLVRPLGCTSIDCIVSERVFFSR